jgi:hypothetical protein
VLSSSDQHFLSFRLPTILILLFSRLKFAESSPKQDAAAIAISTYNNLRVALRPVAPIEPQVSAAVQETQITIPQNFMQEDPVLNIIPPSITFEDPMTTTTVASDSPAVNDSGFPWLNLRDINTGQIYCVAIYNTEVNRYLGPCKNDYR